MNQWRVVIKIVLMVMGITILNPPRLEIPSGEKSLFILLFKLIVGGGGGMNYDTSLHYSSDLLYSYDVCKHNLLNEAKLSSPN